MLRVNSFHFEGHSNGYIHHWAILRKRVIEKRESGCRTGHCNRIRWIAIATFPEVYAFVFMPNVGFTTGKKPARIHTVQEISAFWKIYTVLLYKKWQVWHRTQKMMLISLCYLVGNSKIRVAEKWKSLENSNSSYIFIFKNSMHNGKKSLNSYEFEKSGWKSTSKIHFNSIQLWQIFVFIFS